jgi:hypothetical protein
MLPTDAKTIDNKSVTMLPTDAKTIDNKSVTMLPIDDKTYELSELPKFSELSQLPIDLSLDNLPIQDHRMINNILKWFEDADNIIMDNIFNTHGKS